MRKYKSWIVGLLGMWILMSSCTVPRIAISDDLAATSEEMKVRRKFFRGWNQPVKYGEYTSSKIKRGWLQSSETEIGNDVMSRYRTAENKLQFTQFSPGGEAEVYTVGRLTTTETPLTEVLFGGSMELTHQDTYSGTIIPNNDESKTWEFVVEYPDGMSNLSELRNRDNIDERKTGIAKSKDGEEILIRAVRRMEDQISLIELDNFGFEFVQNNETIGAVSLLNHGRVWMKNDLSEEKKLVLSSLSTAMLVRASLEEDT
ncbi:MAG: hypothetical protein AAFW89_01765 [Bacteroidota bacterium]